jgi:ParB/RepB/Spo0J family partition protein
MKEAHFQAVPLDRLDHGDNVRKVYTDVEGLADTIEAIGLLQNLVVRRDGEKFVVVAGGRRLAAMKKLASTGRWKHDEKVPCLVIEGEILLEQLAENEQRVNLHPWEAGKGYFRLVEKGYTQAQISQQIGKSQSHVSLCVKIHQGLSPKVTEILSRIGSAAPNILEMAKMAELVDMDTGKPDEGKQLEWLERYLVQKPLKKSDGGRRPPSLTLAGRVKNLSTLHVPLCYVPVVDAIVKYLTGVTSEVIFPEN